MLDSFSAKNINCSSWTRWIPFFNNNCPNFCELDTCNWNYRQLTFNTISVSSTNSSNRAAFGDPKASGWELRVDFSQNLSLRSDNLLRRESQLCLQYSFSSPSSFCLLCVSKYMTFYGNHCELVGIFCQAGFMMTSQKCKREFQTRSLFFYYKNSIVISEFVENWNLIFLHCLIFRYSRSRYIFGNYIRQLVIISQDDKIYHLSMFQKFDTKLNLQNSAQIFTSELFGVALVRFLLTFFKKPALFVSSL